VRSDVVAGLTVWAVLVPESFAYATVAGVPPVVGLYAAIPALVLYALVGSSRHLIVAPMSATAALSAGVVATVAGPDDVVVLTAALAVATGLVALAAGLLRLGFLASFISEPVLKGFIVGLALTIIAGQLPSLVGVEGGHGNFFDKLVHVVERLGDADPLTVVVGAASLVSLLVLRRVAPRVPASLVVALLAIAVTASLDLGGEGLAVVGRIDAGLPAFGLPHVGPEHVPDLLAGAVGIMLVGFAEGLGAAKTYAARAGYDVDPNRELAGLGVANLGSGLVSGMLFNGSLSKTAVNGAAGARSPLSGCTAAVLTLLTLLFLTGLFEQLPEPTLAAIVIAAVIELVDLASLRRLWRVQTGRLARVYQLTARADFVAAVAALTGVLLFDTLPGLAIGVAVSLGLLVARTSRPHVAVLAPLRPADSTGPSAWVDVARNQGCEPVPHALVVRVEAPLVFANADYVRTQVRQLASREPRPRVVVLDGRTTPSIDVTAVQMLDQLRNDLERLGIDFVLAENVGQVRDVLRRAESEGEPPLFASIEEALAGTLDRPGPPDSPPTGEAHPGPGS